jgi:hypothetical protein
VKFEAMPWFLQLVAGLSLQRPSSCPGQSMQDLWYTKWHWDRFFFELFGFPLSVSFHHGPPYSYIIWGMNDKPTGGCSSKTQSHPIDMNNMSTISVRGTYLSISESPNNHRCDDSHYVGNCV